MLCRTFISFESDSYVNLNNSVPIIVSNGMKIDTSLCLSVCEKIDKLSICYQTKTLGMSCKCSANSNPHGALMLALIFLIFSKVSYRNIICLFNPLLSYVIWSCVKATFFQPLKEKKEVHIIT